MSKTPRTDAEGVRFARIMIEWQKPRDKQVTELIPADFARTLELELTRTSEALREALDHMESWATTSGTWTPNLKRIAAIRKELGL